MGISIKKVVLAALLATVGGSLAFGAAASLTVNADNLGSGGAAVSSCAEDVSVGFSQVDGEPQLIGGITVAGLEAACAGQTLSYIVSNAASASLVSGTATLGTEASQTIAFPASESGPTVLLAAVIEEVGVTIAGAPATPPPAAPAPAPASPAPANP